MADQEKMSVVNHVRNILMNELGLTRASLREEVSAQIKSLVGSAVAAYMESIDFQRLVLAEIDKQMRLHQSAGNWYTRDLHNFVQETVRQSIADEVKKSVIDKLVITMEAKIQS